MKRFREYYRRIVERCVCSTCPKYKVACDPEKMCCPRVENRINELIEEAENELR